MFSANSSGTGPASAQNIADDGSPAGLNYGMPLALVGKNQIILKKSLDSFGNKWEVK